MEIEAKFSAPDAATLARLGELGELAGYEIAGHEVADMTDVYLDTDDRALRSAGLVCRRRDRGDRVVVTVKRRGGGAIERDGGASRRRRAGGGASEGPGAGAIHRRDEWETELPDGLAPDSPPGSWPAGEVRERVLAAAGDRPLAALVEVGQSRVLRTVSKGGRTVAELSLDTFTIVTGDGALAPQYEVEAELKGDGAEADLGVIAGALQRDFALTPQPLSKFERAMAALAAEPSPAGLLSDDQERLLARISRRTDAVGRRAQVLLALNEGALQRDAAARAADGAAHGALLAQPVPPRGSRDLSQASRRRKPGDRPTPGRRGRRGDSRSRADGGRCGAGSCACSAGEGTQAVGGEGPDGAQGAGQGGAQTESRGAGDAARSDCKTRGAEDNAGRRTRGERRRLPRLHPRRRAPSGRRGPASVRRTRCPRRRSRRCASTWAACSSTNPVHAGATIPRISTT